VRYALLLALVACGKHAAPSHDTSAPELAIAVSYPGASVEDTAGGLANPIEDAIAQLDGVTAIHSRITAGSVLTTIELAPGSDRDQAASRVQAKISAIQRQLPVGATMPMVSKTPQHGAVLRFTLRGNGSAVALRGAFDHAVDALLATPNIGQIATCGGASPQWTIAPDVDRMQATGTTIDQVIAAVRAHPLDGSKPLAEQLADEPLVKDVATISFGGTKDACTASDTTGENAIAATIFPAQNADVVALRDALESALQTARAELPPGWTLEVLPRTRPVALGVALDGAAPNAPATLRAAIATIPGVQASVLEIGAATGGRPRDSDIADLRLVPSGDPATLERDAIRVLGAAGFTVLDHSQTIVRITCTDIDQTRGVAEHAADALDSTRGVDVTARVGMRRVPHLSIDVDRPKLADTGVTAATVADAIRVAIDGLPISGSRVPISIAIAHGDGSTIGALRVRNYNNVIVPLSSLVTVRAEAVPDVLWRENRKPYVDLQVAGSATDAIAKLALPPGCRLRTLAPE
jgi:multidrug efflux pump subunit AcrB